MSPVRVTVTRKFKKINFAVQSELDELKLNLNANRPGVGAQNRPGVGAQNRPGVGAQNRPGVGAQNRPGVGAQKLTKAADVF